ncbi:uncharacterized protein LOC133179251 [Saccostrea echinata]|uniref:uncharacterized protein LOC133179251 n=1 Tax=Saccostrea echinata TaxID=191078 RepID=UPI002A8414EB|nr:uncharacterized protein LOC133179251 [Saccostrea echinata]
MAMSGDNASHQIVTQYCVKRGIWPLPIQETTGRHKRVSDTGLYLANGGQGCIYRVSHAGQTSESFEVKLEVRQGCLLSPFLFLLVIDWIMRTTTSGRNNGIQRTLLMQLDDLDFADDLALLSHNHSQMQDKTTHLATTSAGTGLKINLKKTKFMKISTTP